MKKVLLIASLIVMLASCGKGSKGSDTTNKFIASFIDSVEKAYPNRIGNDIVCKKVIDDFGERIKGMPIEQVFEGIDFYVFMFRYNKIEETGDVISVFSLSPENGGFKVNINCDDIEEDLAMKIDERKVYRITGGTLVDVSNHGIISGLEEVNLGDIKVSKIKVEEVPGKEHKN